MRAWWLVTLAGCLAACAGSPDPPRQPVTFERAIGDTEQGLRMRLERAGATVEVQVVADCDDGTSAHLEREVIRAEVSDDGTFQTTHSTVHEGTDGDEAHLTATVEGRFDGDAVHGALDARVRYWNGQVQDFREDECTTGPIGWRLRSGTWEWPGLEEIPVPGVDWVESRPGGALAFGPLFPEAPDPFAVTTIDAAGSVLGRVDLAIGDPDMVDHLDALAIVDQVLWAIDRFDAYDGAIGRYDTTTGESFGVPGMVGSLTSDGAHLWTIGVIPGEHPIHSLERRDLVTGQVLASTTGTSGRLVVAGDRVWIVGEPGARATAYDRDTLAVVQEIALPELIVRQAEGGDGTLWINGYRRDGGPVVVRVDLATGDVSEHRVEAADLVVVDDEAWIVQSRQRTVRVLDRGGIVDTYDLPVAATSIAADDAHPGVVWVAAGGQDTVVRLTD